MRSDRSHTLQRSCATLIVSILIVGSVFVFRMARDLDIRNRATPAPRATMPPEKALAQKLPQVVFNDAKFVDVVEILSGTANVGIAADWRALEAAGIGRDVRVTARLRDVKLSKAIETILRDIAGGHDNLRLGYTLVDDVVTITTENELNRDMPTAVYDVSDLLGRYAQRADIKAQLVMLIKDTVDADSWTRQDYPPSIHINGSQLVVRQSIQRHRQIGRLLDQLRETLRASASPEVGR